ncbi:malate synthase, glyoxysomal-like isoform X1 [Lytechinus variegatus]|uniref:malate synthase, glyoxysomal-like isoform X1 n=1 Tax=Lytechinus variegatus TaxID=7654 RepID=UPI001BB1EA31|nr:malate synthase, glyoxysomal-like isoform X1 [Lytechinus variegatus]
MSKTKMLNSDVELLPPCGGQEKAYSILLTPQAIRFIADMVLEFNSKVDQILRERKQRKLELDATNARPDFRTDTLHIQQGSWTVDPVPKRLVNRHVDLGDVSPANIEHFTTSLQSSAQGIQTDFDDGHCPTWRTQIGGLYNVYRAVHNQIPGVPSIEHVPILMLRPRAWNMEEPNMMVNGVVVPGPLFDFALLMYHNAKILLDKGCGPFFYLSKIEGYREARLWDKIFTWAEVKLGLPLGCVKATVLIENVLAAFEMHEILYELRKHSAGLNCGLWDYSASFVNKFGHRPDFVLPDRHKYVNMERHFLKSYLALTIKTCHQRGCTATGGMSALLLPSKKGPEYNAAVEKACRAKLSEIKAGVDGFMVYDIGLLQPMQQLWAKFAPSPNQLAILRSDVNVQAKDLLLMPSGGVTLSGLKTNIAVGILFIDSWLIGRGHFPHSGSVEDSATAEISRSQVWQWIRHGTCLEDNKRPVTRRLVIDLIQAFLADNKPSSSDSHRRLRVSANIFLELVTRKDFPEFITTYMNSNISFRAANHLDFANLTPVSSNL